MSGIYISHRNTGRRENATSTDRATEKENQHLEYRFLCSGREDDATAVQLSRAVLFYSSSPPLNALPDSVGIFACRLRGHRRRYVRATNKNTLVLSGLQFRVLYSLVLVLSRRVASLTRFVPLCKINNSMGRVICASCGSAFTVHNTKSNTKSSSREGMPIGKVDRHFCFPFSAPQSVFGDHIRMIFSGIPAAVISSGPGIS